MAQIVECPLKHTDVKADVAGLHRPREGHADVPQSDQGKDRGGLRLSAAARGGGGRHDDGHRRAEDRRPDQAADGSPQRSTSRPLRRAKPRPCLEQERPNIFTQSVGNIEPGQDVKIEISYVDVLRYDMGNYEFHFPMVVGPRYNPGAPIASPPPTPAELAGKVSPPAARHRPACPTLRASARPCSSRASATGTTLSLRVKLDAGVPIQELKSAQPPSPTSTATATAAARSSSAGGDSIPNKDFVLRYDVVGEKPEMAVLAHTGKYSADAARSGRRLLHVDDPAARKTSG